jgi:hypothetical protein
MPLSAAACVSTARPHPGMLFMPRCIAKGAGILESSCVFQRAGISTGRAASVEAGRRSVAQAGPEPSCR